MALLVAATFLVFFQAFMIAPLLPLLAGLLHTSVATVALGRARLPRPLRRHDPGVGSAVGPGRTRPGDPRLPGRLCRPYRGHRRREQRRDVHRGPPGHRRRRQRHRACRVGPGRRLGPLRAAGPGVGVVVRGHGRHRLRINVGRLGRTSHWLARPVFRRGRARRGGPGRPRSQAGRPGRASPARRPESQAPRRGGRVRSPAWAVPGPAHLRLRASQRRAAVGGLHLARRLPGSASTWPAATTWATWASAWLCSATGSPASSSHP